MSTGVSLLRTTQSLLTGWTIQARYQYNFSILIIQNSDMRKSEKKAIDLLISRAFWVPYPTLLHMLPIILAIPY